MRGLAWDLHIQNLQRTEPSAPVLDPAPSLWSRGTGNAHPMSNPTVLAAPHCSCGGHGGCRYTCPKFGQSFGPARLRGTFRSTQGKLEMGHV